MTSLALAEHWSHSADANRRYELSVTPDSARVHLLAMFAEGEAAPAPYLDLVPNAWRRRSAQFAHGYWSVVEDLGPAPPATFDVVSQAAPTFLLARMMAPMPSGGSGAGVLPRCLGPARTPYRAPALDLAAAAERLEQGDLEGAFVFAGKLCLAAELDLLAQFMRPLSAYVVTHPLHRGDQMGLFVAAVSGMRGRT